MTLKFKKLGIISGGGTLPQKLVDACLQDNKPFHILAIEGSAENDWLSDHPHSWIQLGTFKSTLATLEKEACDAVVMVGNVGRPDFKNLKVDLLGARLLPQAALASRKGDDALLRFLVQQFEKFGHKVVGADDVFETLVITKGCMTRTQPSERHQEDIQKALEIVHATGTLDIGQGVVVCRGVILAVEAAEGTDAMLERCSQLPSNLLGTMDQHDGVLVKAKKPNQERRTDLPVIGVETVRRAAKAHLAGIAVEAGNALVLDKDKMVEEADAVGLFVIGIDQNETS